MIVRNALRRLNRKLRAPKRFIVLCHARSGSNLLTWSLGAQEAVEEYGEIFHDSPGQAGLGLPPRIQPYQRGADAARFLDADIFGPCPEPKTRAHGFKIFYDHARSTPAVKAAWRYLIEDTDIRVIHLIRRNLLDCLLSLEVAKRTGEWFRRPGEQPAPPPVAPFSLSPWACLEHFGETTTSRMWATEAFSRHPVLTLEYEKDVCGDFSGAMARAFDFIGVPPIPVTAPVVRQRSREPFEQLLNYDELRRWFRHTLFEEFFPPAGVSE